MMKFTRFGSLWLGKDHLLSIDSDRFSEEYKRFYFRDIQAITIRQTKRLRIWNLVLGILVLLWAGILLVSDERGSAGAWTVMVVILGVPLLLNNILGATCTVYLRTAVHVEELSSLSRIRRATKVLSRIRPLIVAAQGELTPEEAAMRTRELFGSAPPPNVVTGPLNL